MAKKPTFYPCLVTPAMAQDYLTSHMFPGQRPVSPTHVNYLATLMRRGHFRPGTVLTFAYTKSNLDQAQCVNGQHTLHAIVQSKVPQYVTLEYRAVASQAEIASLYASYDRGRMRSITDAIHSFASVGDIVLERTHLTLLSGAIPVIVSGFETPENNLDFVALMRNAESRFQFIAPWVPEMQTILEIVHGENRGHIQRTVKRAAVLAVILVTLRYQPKTATTFWKRVVQDDGLVKGDPEKTLLHFLYATPATHLKPHIYARYVASTWNAAYSKQRITKLYARDSAMPIVIKGTPHRGVDVMRYYTMDGTPIQTPVTKP